VEKKHFEKLFNEHKAMVYGICYRYTRSKEDSLDLVQEVFLKLYQSSEKLEPGREVKPWLRKVAVNTCLNYRRDSKPAVSLEAENELGISIGDSLRDKTDPEESIFAKITGEHLKEFIVELKPEQKTVLILRHNLGLSYKEIAAQMELPEGTIKTHLFQARKLLMQRLKIAGLLEV